jgi:hypothetical protein
MITDTLEAVLDVKNKTDFTLLALSLSSAVMADNTDSVHSLNFKDGKGVDRAVPAKTDSKAAAAGWRELVKKEGDKEFILRYHPSTGQAKVALNTLGLTTVTIQIARENLNRRPRAA